MLLCFLRVALNCGKRRMRRRAQDPHSAHPPPRPQSSLEHARMSRSDAYLVQPESKATELYSAHTSPWQRRGLAALLWLCTLAYIGVFIGGLFESDWQLAPISGPLGNPLVGLGRDVLVKMGATAAFKITSANQWWRLWSSQFVCAGARGKDGERLGQGPFGATARWEQQQRGAAAPAQRAWSKRVPVCARGWRQGPSSAGAGARPGGAARVPRSFSQPKPARHPLSRTPQVAGTLHIWAVTSALWTFAYFLSSALTLWQLGERRVASPASSAGVPCMG